MEQSKINRINELSAISKKRDLTPEEKVERETLRKEYIDGFKANLVSQLDNTYIIDENGKHKLRHIN